MAANVFYKAAACATSISRESIKGPTSGGLEVPIRAAFMSWYDLMGILMMVYADQQKLLIC